MKTMTHSQSSKRTMNLVNRIGGNAKLKTVLLIVLLSAAYSLFLTRPFMQGWFHDFLFRWVLILCNASAGLGIAYHFFLPYLKDKPAKELKKVLFPAFGLFMLAVFVACLLIDIAVQYILQCGIGGLSVSEFIDFILTISIWGMLKEYFIWVLAAMSFFFYVTWYSTATREQHLREENLLYKYKNLKTQVNPHFLFNSLNTLSELVYEDAAKADHYIQRLSGIYRYILDHEETDLVLLSEEIEFVKHYFDLQKERVEDKIQLNIEVQHVDNFKIIPVSLQILVENALKHNSASKENPLQIRMYTTDHYVVVSNTLQRKNILDDSFRTGLSNLAARMKLITGREMVINQENNLFTVELPLVETQK